MRSQSSLTAISLSSLPAAPIWQGRLMSRFKAVLTIFLLGPALGFAAAPDWFYAIRPASHTELIGYGVDQNLEQAKKLAVDDIVKSIAVQVRSSFMLETRVHDASISMLAEQRIDTQSFAVLNGVKIVKTEQINGEWYVAISYDNISIERKVAQTVGNARDASEWQNQYLRKTALSKRIASALGTTLGFGIERVNGMWNLSYKGNYFPLTQDDFNDVLESSRSRSCSLSTNKDVYREYDRITFRAESPKKGYQSLLYVEHDGKVGVILKNHAVEIGTKFVYPKDADSDALVIANPYKKTINELYVLLCSAEKVDLRDFESVTDVYLDESNYNFNKLLSLLDKHEFSTVKIKIKKN